MIQIMDPPPSEGWTITTTSGIDIDSDLINQTSTTIKIGGCFGDVVEEDPVEQWPKKYPMRLGDKSGRLEHDPREFHFSLKDLVGLEDELKDLPKYMEWELGNGWSRKRKDEWDNSHNTTTKIGVT